MTTLIVSSPKTDMDAHVDFYMVRLCIFSYY